jgi:hypothetical protein
MRFRISDWSLERKPSNAFYRIQLPASCMCNSTSFKQDPVSMQPGFKPMTHTDNVYDYKRLEYG